jgi:hypothetical protein
VWRVAWVAATASGQETWTPQAILDDLTPRQGIAIPPAVLLWDGGTVANMAATIYEGRHFDRLLILADALEEAGCDNAEILAHLRGGGVHAKGCWALDTVLGKS